MRGIFGIGTLFLVTLLLFAAPAAAFPAGGGLLWSKDLSHGAVSMLSMTSDGSFVAASTQDGTIVLLNRNAGAIWDYYNTKSNSRYSVAAIHPLGTKVLGATGTYVYMISDKGTNIWMSQDLKENIYDVAFSTDGFGYTTAGNNLYFFDKDGNGLFMLKTASAVWRFAISSDGTYFGTGTSDPDHRVYLYDRNQSLRWTYDPGDAVSDVDVAYRASRVAAGAGQHLYLFNQNGALLSTYECGAPVNGISMSRDGTRVAVGMQDGRVAIYSGRGELIWQNISGGRVYDVALSSDGTQLAVAVDSTVRYFAPDIPIMNPTLASGVPQGAPGTGTVTISSNPSGANVYIDNAYRGITPVTITDIAPGQHTILLRHAGLPDWSIDVDVLSDTTISLSATLSPLPQLSPTKSPLPVTVVGAALALLIIAAGIGRRRDR